MDAEWKIIYGKLDACIALGANIVLSRLPIGDLATQYFADRGVFCAGRITEDDIKRIEKARDLLRLTDLMIAEVAFLCGFCDQSHLTRVFSRRVGMTPVEWRRTSR